MWPNFFRTLHSDKKIGRNEKNLFSKNRLNSGKAELRPVRPFLVQDLAGSHSRSVSESDLLGNVPLSLSSVLLIWVDLVANCELLQCPT